MAVAGVGETGAAVLGAAVAVEDHAVDPDTAGAAGARTRILEAAPRPPREDRVLITDDGTAGEQLARFLVDRKLV